MINSFMKVKDIDKPRQLDLFDTPDRPYMVLINGKLWRKNGVPVEFPNYLRASKAAETIFMKYGKMAQVADPRRWPDINKIK